MNSAVYQNNLKENSQPSAENNHIWTLQEASYSKQASFLNISFYSYIFLLTVVFLCDPHGRHLRFFPASSLLSKDLREFLAVQTHLLQLLWTRTKAVEG